MNYKISFEHEDKLITIKGDTIKKTIGDCIDWLNDNNYEFKGDIHTAFTRRPLSIEEIRSKSQGYYVKQFRLFHKIKGTDKYLWIGGNIKPARDFILKMLENFGIEFSTIRTEGFDLNKTQKHNEVDLDIDEFDPLYHHDEKYSFIEAAQICLKNNNNKPMSVSEIWEEISDLVDFSTKSPLASLSSRIGKYTVNSGHKRKSKNPLFKVIISNPENKYVLIDPTAETQNISDEMEDEDFDDFDIKPFPYKSRLSDASQIEKELKIAQAQPEKTKAQMQSEREKLRTKKLAQSQSQAQGKRVKNPFGSVVNGQETSALCIIGKSGSGKSTTTENALDEMNHEYMVYIPIEGEYTFSQYNGQTFERTDFGDFILKAQNDPTTCYTVIFDECHRPITLSKLNTDLLQALSSRRNRGNKRFFTMDRVTKKLYTDLSDPNFGFKIPLKEDKGKVLVPENFGIICLSSRADIICRNEDLINRVDIVVFNKTNRTIDDLTKLQTVEKPTGESEKLIDIINNKLREND